MRDKENQGKDSKWKNNATDQKRKSSISEGRERIYALNGNWWHKRMMCMRECLGRPGRTCVDSN
jgi:hypothetical protein